MPPRPGTTSPRTQKSNHPVGETPRHTKGIRTHRRKALPRAKLRQAGSLPDRELAHAGTPTRIRKTFFASLSGFFMGLTRPDRTGIWITIYQPAAQVAEVQGLIFLSSAGNRRHVSGK